MNLSNKVNKGLFSILLFTFFMLSWDTGFCQSSTKHKVDSISLDPLEYIELYTNNGSDCVYYICNPSNADIVTAVVFGAPDSLKFDDHSLFNGKHVLLPGQQLIAIGDFMGRRISTENLSSKYIRVILALYCPKN